MRRTFIFSAAFLLMAAEQVRAQSSDITTRNSWLKIGANVGVPVGNISDYSSFTAGLELKGQFLETPHLGIGLTTGYNHYFAKNGFQDFGTIPLGAFIRYYPRSKGFFAGLDLGYSFVTGYDGATGGFYLKPQLGYHNYNWNFFGYFNDVFRSTDDGGDIGSVGVGATYNIRFRKHK
ncbi:hypothetical protein [Taibaiella soli]|uniref:Outer membrane protein beta-barrel domain-containing protein n=1 Tax=Taibaiella soli TaxID=1649169 RepID=A0A2W2AH95_9BACT|nr:hypothetical protein [Taibaiella soli]PZF74865.1 hypothetical protein DN068_01325 [Taibaiella soli]